MLSVALTGNIASGKTTVLNLFQSWGAFTTDADAMVRELQRPGTPVFDAIVRRFGPPVVASDGSLDRGALRRIVLEDPAARADLEALVHPAVHERRAQALAQARASGVPVSVHDIPLLFEAADPSEFDRIVLVEASPARRREWLIQRRGLGPAEADRMIGAQLPSPVKRARSHYVIENDADLATLGQRARVVWDQLISEATRSA